MRIGTILLKYDYGERQRGKSLERMYFYPALKKISKVSPFWIEDHNSDYKQLQRDILTFCDETKCDYYFIIPMLNEISTETLEILQKRGKRVVSWFGDSHWRWEWVKTLAPYLYAAFDNDKYTIGKYRGLCKAIHTNWGVHRPAKRLTADYKYDVSFIGQKNPVREWFINELRDAGIEVKCFGYGWGGKVKNMERVFQASRINLNLSNSLQYDHRFAKFVGGVPQAYKNIEQMKARHFEISGLGGFQLSQYCLELEDNFHIGKELAVFGNLEDLKIQIKYYLSHHKEREKIRRAGWKKAKRYSYEYRLRRAFDALRYSLGR